jgi:hypothetical protein
VNAVRPIRVTLLGGLGDQPITWYTYQHYYVLGLRMMPGLQFRYANPTDRTLAYVRERGWRGAARAWQQVAKLEAARRYERATHVGRYTFHFPQQTSPLRIAIDAHDARDIRDPQAYDWSHIYFKVNRWTSLDYGPKVRPLVTGNGALNYTRIARLVALRNQPKTLDLVCIAKLWPSRPSDSTYWNPVEHLVKVFETLARLPCRSYLRAIVPQLKGESFPQRFLDRLADAGVQVTETNVTIKELWDATSAARLAFLRPGKHLCISWRMIDHLAMGACTVCDRAPYAEWPVPLRLDYEFTECGCGIGYDETLPDDDDYARIADTVMALLADRERAAGIRRMAAAYFDHHLAPKQVAHYLVATAGQIQELPQPSPCALPRIPRVTASM